MTPGNGPLRVFTSTIQQDLVQPSSQRGKFQATAIVDVLHHETNLVHVGGYHDAGGVLRARLLANQATQVVLVELGLSLKPGAEEIPHLALKPRHTIKLRQRFQQFNGFFLHHL